MRERTGKGARGRGERGAALITALLMTTLLLSAGGALILTTSMSATTAADATAEMQAYYAAEAGLEAALAVLRGNVPANPAGLEATFRSAVCGSAATCTNAGSDLSRWLTYNAAGRVPLSTSPATSYSLTVRDASLAPTATLPAAPYLPRYLVVTSTGFGPKGSRKVLEMTVDHFAFEFTVRAAVAIRSNDLPNEGMTIFDLGTSSPHLWNGNDLHPTAPSPPVAAFAVTNRRDYDGNDNPPGLGLGSERGIAEAAISTDGANIIGAEQLAMLDPLNLEWWLQDADNARLFLTEWRREAEQTGRFNPTDFGSDANPKFSFVDGDVDFTGGSSGGAGLLIVTGNYVQGGSASFKGIILALGNGVITRNGNPDTYGAMVVARFNRTYDPATKSYTGTGDFLSPSITTDGGGNSLVGYNSDWVRKAMETLGGRVVGVVEK